MTQQLAKFIAIPLASVLLLGNASVAVAQRTLAITGARIETVSKAGAIESGTLLIRDGKILALGKDVDIPVSAQVIDAAGKTIMPGIVDPYFVVTIGRNVQSAPTRTVVFQGRTFVVGGGSPGIATTFAKLSDGFDVADTNWNTAIRSGITSYHIVTGGYAQSLLAQLEGESVKVTVPAGSLLVTVTNSTESLDVLRNGLKEATSRGGPSAGGSPSSRFAGLRRGAPPTSSSTSPSGSSATVGSKSNSTAALWSSVREGKTHVFVNVNNPASILHVQDIAQEQTKAKIALIASGQDAYLALESIEPKQYSLILPPRIDLIPNSQNRVNVPKLLADKGVEFAFSLSLGQTDFRDQQDAPLFGVGMLVRSGLSRDTALRALTMVPAKMLGIDTQVGSLEVGKQANFIVLDGDPLATSTGIDQVFVEGKPTHAN